MYTANGHSGKDDLITRHAPLVKRIAYHLLGRLPASVSADDLIQAGMLGLLDAAHQYDPSQGASFETYASIRIRGAMLDELRRTDWAPKSVHRKARELASAIRQVETATGREASDHEVAEVLGISPDEYHHLLQETSSSRMLSVEELSGDEGDVYDRIGGSTPSPVENLEESEFREQLLQAIGSLPEREQLIMSLYYEQELNLREIGAVLNVSESRISQLLSQAHTRLRARMHEHLA
jgi:RNA polymerase sigma factor for flagellar operon FliA